MSSIIWFPNKINLHEWNAREEWSEESKRIVAERERRVNIFVI